jgi:hypothetical protein
VWNFFNISSFLFSQFNQNNRKNKKWEGKKGRSLTKYRYSASYHFLCNKNQQIAFLLLAHEKNKTKNKEI